MKRNLQIAAFLVGSSLLFTEISLASPEANSSSIPLSAADQSQKSDPNWANHYSLNAALSLAGAGVWNPITAHHPDELVTQGEFFNELRKVTGSTEEVDIFYDTEQNITRVTAAKWVQELTHFNTGIVNPEPPFSDLTGNEVTDSAIRYVFNTGIMMGDAIRFYPDKPLTRGQAAIVLNHVLKRMPQMAKKIHFETIEPNHLPETTYTLWFENTYEAGLSTSIDTSMEGYARYLIVAGGEQPTGGYSVVIQEIYETSNAIYVQASLEKPDPVKAVIQVLTYPSKIAKIQDLKKPVFLLP